MINYANSREYTLVAVKKTDVEKLNDFALTAGISMEHIDEDNYHYLTEVLSDHQSDYESSYESSYDSSSC